MWWIVGIIILIAAVSSKRFRIAVIALVIIAIAFVIHPSIGIIASIAGLIMSIRCYVFTKEGSYLKYNFRGYEEEKYSSNQTSNANTPISQPSSKTYSAVNKTTSVVNHTNPVANKPSTKSSTNSYSSYNKIKEYDKYGFDQDGINRETGTKRNKRGFDKSGKNRYTGTNYDSNGYDIGWYSRTGYNKHGLDKDGYDRRGFDKNGIHKLTGTKRDENGFNKDGIHKVTGVKFNENFNDATYYQPKKSQKFENRFDSNGINKETGTKWDKRGFDKNGINKFTGDKYDENGYDCERYNRRGFNKHGYNREGYDRRGFDKKGIHKDTGIEWDKRGFDRNGINKDTGTIYSVYHFDINGKNEFTGTKFDEEGFDVDGYNILGMDRKGYKNTVSNLDTSKEHENQKNTEEKNLGRVYNNHGFDQNGFDKQGYHRITGKIVNEQGLTREEVELGVAPKQEVMESRFQKIPTNQNKQSEQKIEEKNGKYDRYGFDEDGNHRKTGTRWDEQGFDVSGINIDTGTIFSIYHFDRNGINEFTGTKYDEEGYDVEGYNEEGFDRNGEERDVDNIQDKETNAIVDDGEKVQEEIIQKVVYEAEKLSDEIVTDQLKKELNGDIYSMKYAETILIRNKIKPENYKKSLESLGYSVKSGYIIKKKFRNFKKYLERKIISEDTIRIEKDIIDANYNTVADFCREYKLFKVKEGLYISWTKMNENGIDKTFIKHFFNELENTFGMTKFFSIKNIKDKINVEKFDRLGLDDDFIENIIFYGKGLYTLRLNNNKLFTYIIEKPTKNDFIENEMENYISISLSEFAENVRKTYGLDLDYDIVKYYTYGLKNIYYNPTMDKLYLTKQDFYNEIYDDEGN